MAQDIEVWEQKYKPIRNPRNRPEDGNAYEWDTHEDVEYIKKMCEEAPDRVWTEIDNGMGWYGVVAGWHYVNRLSYRITEIPWTDENEEYTIYDTGPLREQWEALPIEAIEEVIGESLQGRTEMEIGEITDENFYQWEEMHELDRDALIDKYKKQDMI